MKKFDLDQLAIFVAVADAGSFVRGAEWVHRSQSAVSMQIKSLEALTGRPLFARTTRNLALTADGQTLLGYARRLLQLRDQAWGAVVHPQLTGRVAIGVPDDYAATLLPPVLRRFSASYPGVDIEVVGLPSYALLPLLRNNRLDLACMTRIDGVSGEFVRNEPMIWAGSAQNRQIGHERPLPIAVFGAGSTSRTQAIRALQEAGIAYRMSYESPSLMGLLSMVDAGLAVAPLARCAVPERLIHLGTGEGLPALPALEVVLARSARSTRPPCDFLAEQILLELRL
ncbi:LysR substrate-binding domain-containing protein [Pseudomonas sp. HR96]|uniref:LysR substrate-binding domain-containing protein n=1 Tax=Pseudomonas sp. HR96 TaxID=1027966 RepID=UPI002A7661CB|nr:LysR substrate-binding domain-containing protein [Pseudomonas sp. HR96]WPO97752.1 LysR substrate-binding domain-containing protein [Pseudomonas sp. HR96]